MIPFELSDGASAAMAIGILLVMFILLARETYPSEVVAFSTAAVFLATGVLPFELGLGVLSNPAPWTIAAMFVIVGALVRTGALEWLTRRAMTRAEESPKAAVVGLMGTVLLTSAFVSNTPIVVVMIPVFIQVAQKLGVSPSKLMMPLSYITVMGGTITLIGTTSNLLIDGVAYSQGLEHFSIFEVTPLALIIAAWGCAYMALAGPRLLPDRDSMASMLSGRRSRRYLTEVLIPPDSDLVGAEVTSVVAFKRSDVRLVDVVRGGESLRNKLAGVTLRVGDRVVLRTKVGELLNLQQNKSISQKDQLSSVETATVEVLIAPDCKMIGKSLGSMQLRRRYGVYPLAIHRRNQNIGQLDELVVQVGDTLLLEGTPEDIQNFAAEMNMVDVSKPTEQAYRRSHAPIPIICMFGIVALAGIGAAPILGLAIMAMAIILLTRCIDVEEAFSFINGRLITLILSMLAIAKGLENSGAVQLVVDLITPVLSVMPPFLLIWGIYLLTSLLAETVNHTVAVVITPVAIGLAASLGVDPRGLVVAVMLATALTFSTPIGYQTHMMVYGPGGYQFKDFVKFGTPLSLSCGVIASAFIPLLWPL